MGTGIGLSIVSTILDAHGMKYGVSSDDTETVFWFDVTVSAPPEPSLQADKNLIISLQSQGLAQERTLARCSRKSKVQLTLFDDPEL